MRSYSKNTSNNMDKIQNLILACKYFDFVNHRFFFRRTFKLSIYFLLSCLQVLVFLPCSFCIDSFHFRTFFIISVFDM